MNRSLSKRTYAMVLVPVLLLSMLPTILNNVMADSPMIISVDFSPEPYDIDSPLNVTVTFAISGEPITQVSVQSCHGGMCDLPLPMTDDGTGTVFYREYPGRYFGTDETLVYFHFFIDYGVSSFVMIPSDPESHLYNVTMKRTPKALLVSAEPDRSTLFPNQTVTVTGKVMNDLGQNVSGADVVLSLTGTSGPNTTTTDVHGNFSISVEALQTGDQTLNLTVTSGQLAAYRDWTVRVDSWPLPHLLITGQISFTGTELPPGPNGSLLYSDTDVNITYQIRNSGNGEAYNVTASVLDVRRTTWSNSSIGTLNPTERYEGQIQLRTNMTGEFTYIIDARFDQMAPEGSKMAVVPLTMTVTFVPRPVWTGHRPFVEMFTQTTCAPCVFMEEALERLHISDPERLGLLLYVFDDQASGGAFQRHNVTSTPEVLVDRTHDRIRGVPTGEDVGSLMDLINGSLDDATSREAPPLVIDLSADGPNTTVNVHLMPDYPRTFSGLLQVYEIEPMSNLRNNIGVPIANRFMGAVGGVEITDLVSGSDVQLVVPTPARGRSLTAVVLSLDGTAVQSADLHLSGTPPIFIEEKTLLLSLDVPGSLQVPFNVESFPLGGDALNDVTFYAEIKDIPDGWSVGPSPTGPWTRGDLSLTFKYAEATRSMLSVGRLRYDDRMSLYIKADGPAGQDDLGLMELTLSFSAPERTYELTLLVDVKDASPSNESVPEIKEFYLKGEERSIFFYVRAENVSGGLLVKGRVVPCTQGDDARCGVPKDLTFVPSQGGLYRATVQGDDLKDYTHLTYNAWIESDGMKVYETEPRTVEIGSLIELPSDDDDENGKGSLLIPVISVTAVVILVLLVVLVLFLVKRPSQDISPGPKEEDTTMGSGPLHGTTSGDGIVQTPVDEVGGPGPDTDRPIAPGPEPSIPEGPVQGGDLPSKEMDVQGPAITIPESVEGPDAGPSTERAGLKVIKML